VATQTLAQRLEAVRRAQLELDLELRRCYSVMNLVEKRCDRLVDDIEKRLEALARKASILD
jgi:hypothetical protein